MASYITSQVPAGRLFYLCEEKGVFLYSEYVQRMEFTYKYDSVHSFALEGIICDFKEEDSVSLKLAMKVLLGDKLAAYKLADEVLKDDTLASAALTQLFK